MTQSISQAAARSSSGSARNAACERPGPCGVGLAGRGRPPGLVADLPPEIHVGHAGVSPPYPAVEGGGRHLELALPRLGYLGGREPARHVGAHRRHHRLEVGLAGVHAPARLREKPVGEGLRPGRGVLAPSTCGCSGTSGSGTVCTPTATSGAWGTRPPGRPRRALPCRPLGDRAVRLTSSGHRGVRPPERARDAPPALAPVEPALDGRPLGPSEPEVGPSPPLFHSPFSFHSGPLRGPLGKGADQTQPNAFG